MGITDEESEIPESGEIKGETFEDNISGTYRLPAYVVGWSLDLSSSTITVNVNPDLGTKVITRDNTVVEYRIDSPRDKAFLAKISADFNLKQLVLNGYANYTVPRPHRPTSTLKTRKYENVLLTTW